MGQETGGVVIASWFQGTDMRRSSSCRHVVVITSAGRRFTFKSRRKGYWGRREWEAKFGDAKFC